MNAARIDSWRGDGVPFFIRAGKCLPRQTTKVLVTLKRPPLSKLCPPAAAGLTAGIGGWHCPSA